MANVEVTASPLWRTLEVTGGLIVIALAFVALGDPQFTAQLFAIVIASGLVIGGLFRISVGVFAKILPSPLRTLNTAGGIVAVVLGIVALVDLQAAVSTLITILALALLLVGAFEIGVGVVRHPPVWLRATIVVTGILTVILSGYAIIDISIGQGVLAVVLAIALLLVGLRNIVHGITGHHRMSRPIDASVVST